MFRRVAIASSVAALTVTLHGCGSKTEEATCESGVTGKIFQCDAGQSVSGNCAKSPCTADDKKTCCKAAAQATCESGAAATPPAFTCGADESVSKTEKCAKDKCAESDKAQCCVKVQQATCESGAAATPPAFTCEADESVSKTEKCAKDKCAEGDKEKCCVKNQETKDKCSSVDDAWCGVAAAGFKKKPGTDNDDCDGKPCEASADKDKCCEADPQKCASFEAAKCPKGLDPSKAGAAKPAEEAKAIEACCKSETSVEAAAQVVTDAEEPRPNGAESKTPTTALWIGFGAVSLAALGLAAHLRPKRTVRDLEPKASSVELPNAA